ncbi:MAG: hypothetical protein Q4A65_07455 [Bacillota bacterium]|nr:hypothetical protein [Bacillota bacterium]
MRRIVNFVAVCLLSLMVTVAFCSPADTYAAGTTKKPKADAVDYYKDSSGKLTGIKSITINPFTYYNVSRDPELNPASDKSTMVLDEAAMRTIAAKQIFPRWGVIAEGIFRDQANQLVTIEGSGMMSSDGGASNSFDRHFSKSKPGISGYNYDWALDDLASTLGNPEDKSKHSSSELSEFVRLKGSTNYDEVVYSGLFPINNLKEARTLMGKSLRACADDNDLTVDDFLGNSYDKTNNKYRLPDLDNDKTGGGLCNVVTCVNRAGSSGDYDYVCFGLAVYDFDVTPIAAQDLAYIRAAQDFDDSDDPIKAAKEANAEGVFYEEAITPTVSILTNKSSQESTSAVSLTSEENEEIGTTTEDSFEWGMEQEIGTDIGIGKSDAGFARVTLHFQQNFHELWNTMKGTSQTSSKSESRTVNQELALPGHTAAKITQSNTVSNGWENYQQPVVINYKVAIFAMSGDYYNGWGGLISDSRYDKEWMSILFDGSDGTEPGGCKAIASLHSRAVVNKDTEGYDKTKGKYNSWCDKSSWSYNTKINWGNIATNLAGDTRDSHNITNYNGTKSSLQELASELSFAETARKFTRNRKIMTSTIDTIVPLYNLKAVDITDGSRNYDILTGKKLYLDCVDLGGFDKDNVELYGFDPGCGQWNLSETDLQGATTVTENGITQQTTQDGMVTLCTDDVTGSQWISVSGDEMITSDKPYHLKWEIDEDAKILTNETFNDAAGHPDGYMTKEELAEVETPSLGLSVKSDTTGLKSINVDGSYTGPYDESINLNRELDVTARKTDDTVMNIPIYWEDNDVRTITVAENGDTSFTTPGEYKVRAYSLNNGQKIVSNWITIKAKAKAALSTIDFRTALDQDDLTLTKKYPSKSYDLNSFVKYYDQFGEVWEGTKDDPLPEMQFEVDTTEGAEIDDGILTVSEAGTYKITAKAFDENGNELAFSIPVLKLIITEDRWLNSIEFETPALGAKDLALYSKEDQIKIENLKGLLSYYDQKDKAWTGETPKVSFSLKGEPKGAEIKSGSGYTFFAYEPGVYTIQPVIEGFDVNSVTIEVTENPYLVIETSDPQKQPITEKGQQVILDLDKYVHATTQFDGTWKDGVPAMNYTLDEGVEGALIREATRGEGDDMVTIENAFVSDTPGKYIVHVSPKKASAYTGDIDDIEITVYKKRRVEIVGIDFSGLNVLDRTVQEGWTLDPSKYLIYYDQFGDRISEVDQEGMQLPEVTGYEVDASETVYENPAEVQWDSENKCLTATAAGSCAIIPVVSNEYIAFPGILFLIDEETNAAITAAMGQLVDKYLAVCPSHYGDAEPVLIAGINNISRANDEEAINTALQDTLDMMRKYDHTPGAPVKENEDLSAGTFDEVTYCDECGKELSRKTLKIESFKADNPLDVTGKTATIKYKKLKKKSKTLEVTKVLTFEKDGKGAITYKKLSGNKKITINETTGKVTVKKKLKKGTYKVTALVKAAGDDTYKAAEKEVSFKIRVKK